MPVRALPYSVTSPVFPFPALAALAARAPAGGARDAALACLVVTRLALRVGGSGALAAETRATRAAGARTWLTAHAVPASLRQALARAIDASVGDGVTASRDSSAALRAVCEEAGELLNRQGRLEIEHVADELDQMFRETAGNALRTP